MRLWDKKEHVHDQALRGMQMAEPDKYIRLPSEYGYGLYKRHLPPQGVRVIVNGGGGYGPMWAGFVGDGLADAMVHGEFDSAPNAYVLYEMAKTIAAGQGVLFLTNHFMGDYLNNDMAVELLARDGIAAKACYVTDDILSCRGEPREHRGGLHGIGQICKIAAAGAKAGMGLDELYRLAQKANSRLRSVSVNIRDGKVLLGEGFSGEPAVISEEYRSLAETVEAVVNILSTELNDWRKEPWYLSLGTHCQVGYIEGFALLNTVAEYLQKQHIELHGCAVGTYFDVFAGSGCMISLLACDQELQTYLRPVAGYGYTV